ncbi:hypothetical protein B0A50_02439 [Salinomyces thailandicus]|uniref:Btz domain-containing protein n=1 Tax=Salinomyces thailandicus TaxID=706561 RepID=A0A4V5N5W3_9PEZI|nr:hypothetical protein B0A50_02439 [Salinomyces thailandica]
MAAGRALKSLISRRRRAGNEGEDEEGPVIVNDSQSEGSLLSDADDDERSSVGDPGATMGAVAAEVELTAGAEGTNGLRPAKKARNRKKGKPAKEQKEPDTTESQQSQVHSTSLKAMTDTEAMMNGLRIDDGEHAPENAVDFESMGENGNGQPESMMLSSAAAMNGSVGTPTSRQRREHAEYVNKRDADPSFTPNRGNFFMHDTRGRQNGPGLPIRGAWQGRGRGRGGPAVGGPFSPANQMAQAERAAEQPWKHDLHDTINEEPANAGLQIKEAVLPQGRDAGDSARLFSRLAPPPGQGQHKVLSFSSTTLVGKVQIRVLLPGMRSAIAFSEVPWKHYLRLPNHRPPLRRDKPVRISLPDRAPQYVFPSTDRSFIFVPRQNRPAQQGLHRGGSYQRSIGGYGYSSRRTSMYGGSVYASSVAASRRSSMAGGSRADAFSPTSFASAAGMGPATRPVVRLPHGAQPFSAMTTPSGPLSGQHTPIMQTYTYPLPQQPTFQGTPTSTVHQPRPQKAISVTGIESPALLQQQTPSQDQQPFYNQLPAHVDQQPYGQQQPYFAPQQQYQYPPQPQASTPLAGIPEQAAHGFQPPAMSYGQPPYYPQFPPQHQYYYSPPGQNGYPQMPTYLPPPQGYMMPPPMPPSQPPAEQHHQPQQSTQEEESPQHHQPQSGMVAQERNGMVFYVPQSEADDQGQNFQPAESFVPSYAMPGLAPPTPAPDASYYYPQPVYYGAQAQ